MFCSIERYSHIGLGVGHVGIVVGTHIALRKPFLYGVGVWNCVVGASHPHVGASHSYGGINNSNLMSSLEGVPKLSH
jgi:hypothetical protein